MERFNRNLLSLDFLIIFILLLSFPLFFYKLGESSLVSFDEAWYGDIARNILNSKDPINLVWNGHPYIDHPPAGFWLMALSEWIFGVNEFGVRFAPAFCGLLSMVVLYLLGKELFGRIVGFASALALPGAFWFLFRARSGNLDIILTFFFLLTLYLAIKASREKKFLLPWSVSLSFLFLTKTLIPLAIVPSLVIIFWKIKYKTKDFLWPGLVFVSMAGGWFLINYITHPGFIQYYLSIGLPGIKGETNYLENFKRIKGLLHSGVGKWFWPGVASTGLGVLTRQKRFLILSLFLFTFFIPFIFSSKGQIWHLIPVYPILILSFFGMSYVILKKFAKSEFIILALFLILVGYVSFIQTGRSWYEFIDIPRFLSDEAILSREASKYPYKLYIDGDFLPAAIFYSGKKAEQVGRDKLGGLFKEGNMILVITYQYQLDGLNIKKSQYQVLKTDRDKMLILLK